MPEETPKPATGPLVESDAPEISPEQSSPEAPKNLFTPVTILALIAIVLVGVLIVLNVKKGRQQKASPSDISSMQAEVNARYAELNRQRAELGLAPLSSGAEPIEDISKRLKKDADTLVLLTSRFQAMLGEKDTLLSARNEEIIRSSQVSQSLTAECARLRSQLQSAQVTGSEADLLRNKLTAAQSQLEAVLAELSQTRSKLAAQGAQASAADYADLQRRLQEATNAKDFFENKSKQLEAELAKLRIFAKSENELLPDAVELFRGLRDLENRPDSDLTTAYSNIGVQLGANVLRTLNFDTGSSGISPEDDAAIRGLSAEVPDGDLILVVGYASKTGNVDSNRQLSSDRATAVAQMISGIKRPAQNVQAVYLGQTDRFSSRYPERNQLCEIWRIRKK